MLLVVLCVVVVALARQVGLLHLRLGPRGALEIDTEGPGSRGGIPAVEAREGGGGSRHPRRSRRATARPVLVADLHRLPRGRSRDAGRGSLGGLVPQIVHDLDAERTFDVPGTPFLLVLDELGIVRAKGTVNTLEQVEGWSTRLTGGCEEEGERWAS